MKQRNLNTLYCERCGSDNVEIILFRDEKDYWCEKCKCNVRLVTLKELWEKFSEIPVVDDEIQKDFLSFEAGTPVTDVWHWFDDRCPNNLHDDLMY